MSKGCCAGPPNLEKNSIVSSKKTSKTSKTSKPSNTGSSSSSNSSTDQEAKGKHAENLILYQKTMEKDPYNKSVSKKILTKKMAEDYANVRGFAGEGLGQCVYPNVYNTKCLCPYAVSPDCYNVFADFFGEIIEEIHGAPKRECSLIPHFGKLKTHSLVNLNSFDRSRQRILYSDIIVRRNIENIAFTPMMSSSERKNIISKVEPKLRTIFEYSDELASIPLEWEYRMNSTKDDLDDCNAMSGYPDGRLLMVFKNYSRIYEGCVLNFDDHIQFIVSTYDGRIGELFGRMHHILSHEELADIDYSAHSMYGHLTLSPQYVGTGFTMNVLAKLPFVSRLADTNALIKQFGCATKYEIPKCNTGLLLIFNTKTLNKTESEIFKDMVLAFNKLSALEDELELTTPMSVPEDVMSVENLDTLVYKINENESKSYTKKFLTEDLVKQYDGVTTRFGTRINNCIRHNAYHPKSLFPRACDSECYNVFQTFFNPIILQTNQTNKFNHSIQPDYGSTTGNALYKIQHPDILSYRVRFSRNFNSFPYPSMMSESEREEVERVMIRTFDEFPVEIEGQYIPLDKVKTSIYYEEITKYKLLPTSNDIDYSSGMYKDWPAQRGIFFSRLNNNYPNIYVVILVNFMDHIKVISLDPNGKSLDICYSKAITVMKFLELRFMRHFASKIGFGFLTAMPNSVGCGMRISSLVKLEALGRKREVFERECQALQFVYRGSTGHGTVAADNVFDVAIKMNLNVTEKWVVMIFAQRLKDLILKERQLNCTVPIPTNYDTYDDSDESKTNTTQKDQLSNKSKSITSTQKSEKKEPDEEDELKENKMEPITGEYPDISNHS